MSANVSLNFYGGDLSIDFDCSGDATKCKYALCEIMPPEGPDGCAYRQHGTCNHPMSKINAVENLRRRLGTWIKTNE